MNEIKHSKANQMAGEAVSKAYTRQMSSSGFLTKQTKAELRYC